MLENILNSIKEKARKLRPIASAAVLASSLFLPAGVKAETRKVPSQYPTMQEAVSASQNGDTVLVADGTYSAPSENGITWNASEKHLTVKSENGPENCIIDCQSKGRAFTLNSSQTTNDIIQGFTIKNGKAKEISDENEDLTGGGGILIKDCSPYVRDCIIEHCQSGGIKIIGGSFPIIEENTIRDNRAANSGGGIHCILSEPTIRNNKIQDNYSESSGGGIKMQISGGLIENNLVAGNNSKGEGAGILLYKADPVIINNTITDNAKEGIAGSSRNYRTGKIAVIENNIVCRKYNNEGAEDIRCSHYDNLKNNLIGAHMEMPQKEDNLYGAYPFLTKDYKLQEGSLCIDSASSNAPSRDLEGNLRDSKPDIGCYEYTPK